MAGGISKPRQIGLVIGGSGLVGGCLVHHFKTRRAGEYEVLAPNSKKLSLVAPGDIADYLQEHRPAFIVNAAIAAIDSDPQLAFEVNYQGAINLARAALALGIPYIHISSSATLPNGDDLREEDRLPLGAGLGNYAKSKLMAELTLGHLHRRHGLDVTILRLAIVYGEHDHKIQGFHRLFFAIVNRALPLLFTRPGVMHSYTNVRKIPFLVDHLLEHRAEFSGQTYNVVDRNPVALAQLILTIKSYLELKTPREIYLPYPVARVGKNCLQWLVRGLNRIGVEARMPGELMFLENFYCNQTLSAAKLEGSSFVDPEPEATVYTELPALIQYYLTRWEHLNLIRAYNPEFYDPRGRSDEFLHSPVKLLEETHHDLDKQVEAP